MRMWAVVVREVGGGGAKECMGGGGVQRGSFPCFLLIVFFVMYAVACVRVQW